MKTAEEFVTFGQGNVEAIVKSGQIMATGMQELTKQMAASAQASMSEAMSMFQALSGVRSMKEAVELQTNMARTSVEKALTQTGHVAESGFKLAEQAFAPITSRMSLAVETFSKTA